jgi:hypothetical protein
MHKSSLDHIPTTRPRNWTPSGALDSDMLVEVLFKARTGVKRIMLLLGPIVLTHENITFDEALLVGKMAVADAKKMLLNRGEPLDVFVVVG